MVPIPVQAASNGSGPDRIEEPLAAAAIAATKPPAAQLEAEEVAIGGDVEITAAVPPVVDQRPMRRPSWLPEVWELARHPKSKDKDGRPRLCYKHSVCGKIKLNKSEVLAFEGTRLSSGFGLDACSMEKCNNTCACHLVGYPC